MAKYLKLIWFFEDDWTKYHASVGSNAKQTLCGIKRSTRPILPREKLYEPNVWKNLDLRCHNCLAALRKRYGNEDIERVKVA